MHVVETRSDNADREAQYRPTCSGQCAECALTGSASMKRRLEQLEKMQSEVFSLRSSRRSVLEAEIRVARQEAYIAMLKLSCPSRYL